MYVLIIDDKKSPEASSLLLVKHPKLAAVRIVQVKRIIND